MSPSLEVGPALPLYNRHSGKVESEQVFKAKQMAFFYGHPLGRLLERRLLCRPLISKLYRWLHSRPDQAQAQIQEFVTQYGLELSELTQPLEAFKSFQDFFIRQLKAEARPLPADPSALIAPADARLLAYALKGETLLTLKGRSYSLFQLLRNRSLAQQFAQGWALVYRLAPVDYHRFAYIDKGWHGPHVRLPGVLHSVHPFSLQTGLAVFSENQREYTLLHTERFGPVLHLDVGALLVGRMVQHFFKGTRFERGQEKGYFELGGSTIIQLFMPERIRLDPDILDFSAQGIETLVQYASTVGRAL